MRFVLNCHDFTRARRECAASRDVVKLIAICELCSHTHTHELAPDAHKRQAREMCHCLVCTYIIAICDSRCTEHQPEQMRFDVVVVVEWYEVVNNVINLFSHIKYYLIRCITYRNVRFCVELEKQTQNTHSSPNILSSMHTHRLTCMRRVLVECYVDAVPRKLAFGA